MILKIPRAKLHNEFYFWGGSCLENPSLAPIRFKIHPDRHKPHWLGGEKLHVCPGPELEPVCWYLAGKGDFFSPRSRKEIVLYSTVYPSQYFNFPFV